MLSKDPKSERHIISLLSLLISLDKFHDIPFTSITQASRYIKQRMGDELKNKILEHHGIKIINKQTKMVSRTCSRCGYVNSLSNRYCEKTGCAYPLTQEAFEEIKAAEQAKMQELVNISNLERDNTIQLLQQELKSYDERMSKMQQGLKLYAAHANELTKEVFEKMDQRMDKMASKMKFYEHQWEAYREEFGPRHLTNKERDRLEGFLEQLKNTPDSGDD